MHPDGQMIHKGFNPDVDSYSAFFDNQKLSKTSLEEILRKEDVTDVYVCGIATDVCVGNTPQLMTHTFSLRAYFQYDKL